MKKWHTLSITNTDGRVIKKDVLCESEEIEDLKQDFADTNSRKAEDVSVQEKK